MHGPPPLPRRVSWGGIELFTTGNRDPGLAVARRGARGGQSRATGGAPRASTVERGWLDEHGRTAASKTGKWGRVSRPCAVGGIPTTADERPARAAVVALPGPAVAHEEVARLGVRRVVQVPQPLLLGEDVRARVREPVDGQLGPEAVGRPQGPRRRRGAPGMRTACVFVIAPATWRRFVPTKVTDGASRDSVSSPDTRDVCLSGESAVSKLVTDAPSVGIRTSRFPRPIGVAEIKPPRGTEPREPSSPKSWGVACEPASAKDAASCSVSAKATRFTSSLSGRYASA